MNPAVELLGVDVLFGDYAALRRVSFSVAAGQFVAIVGPTGCGKTSVLNLVAGLRMPSSGTVRSGGRTVAAVNRDAAYMFQQDALLPWKTAIENVALGPILRGTSKASALEEAQRWLDRVGLAGFERRYPFQLSGGQQKRVAMAQALINRLPLLLMDEPFSALDVQTRTLMENELLSLWKDVGATVLFVTHDLEEAISMSDRILLFSAGPEAGILGDFEVPLPRPRNVLEARFTRGFSEIYETIWAHLRTEVLKTYERARRSDESIVAR